MLSRYFLKILLCCCFIQAWSQPAFKNSADSIAFQKADKAFKMGFSNSDSALLLANEALREATTLKSDRSIANAMNAIGWTMMHKGHLDSSVIYLQRAWQLFSSLKSEDDIVRVSINIAEVYTKQNNISAAIKYLVQADSICIKTGNIPFHTNVKRQLGIVYREAGDDKKALEYFQQAMDGFLRLKDYFRYSGTVTSVSILYRKMKLMDSSLAVLNRLLNLAKEKKIEITLYQQAMIEEHLAETWFGKENYHEALKHYTVAYAIFEKMNNKADMAFEAFSIGKTLTKLNRFAEAEKYLLQSYNINDTLKMLNYQADASAELAELYKKTGGWKNAAFYLQKTAELKDSLDLADQVSKTNELKEKFETEKKEQQIALLKSQHQLTKWWIFSGLMILVLAGLVFWISIYRKRIRQEKILNHFATSLYNQTTVDDVLWDVARNCVQKLGFEDCVVYGYDENRQLLVQKAAFGPKNPEGRVISNLLELPLGNGIVGSVALSGKPEIIKDTRKDVRYLVDDAERRSEITVPILSDGKLLGVIDSEHSNPGFYKKKHLDVLLNVADICSKKITRYFIEESLRRKISRDLHDDIGSALSSIEISSRIALAKKDDQLAVNNQLEKIQQHTRSTMESMSDIIWSINPQNDNVESILMRMRQFAAELCEPLGITLQFNADINTESLAPGPEKRQHIFLIYKEAVNNAVKYSGCTSLLIELKKTGNDLVLRIADNGKGFDEEIVKKGNGLRNMRARAEHLKGRLLIFSETDAGTTITLQCPV
jgi:signal transduction histidine kinase